MPVAKILPNGVTVSTNQRPGTHERAKRSTTKGWTPRASRGNRRFLWSVNADQLDGQGYAITLTVRDKIPSAQHWADLRRAWVERMRRAGMIRLHWVTEWQLRGVPHLHGAIWFPTDVLPPPVAAWLDLANPYGAGDRGQDIRKLYGVPGWFEYLAKHAARSVANYQRNPANIPAGWKRTGRMWGYVGNWPTSDELEVRMNHAAFFRYRRLVIRYQIAKARAAGDWRRVRFLSQYLQVAPEVSQHRGIGEWVPQRLQMAMMASVAAQEGSQLES